MKKIYKILLFSSFLVLTFLTYKDPILIDEPSLTPVLLFCLWFIFMYITSFAVYMNREITLFSKQDKEFDLRILSIGVITTMCLLSLTFMIFILSEREWVRWTFTIWTLVISIVPGIMIIKKFSRDQLSWVNVGAFYAFPLLTILLSMIVRILKENHESTMIFSICLCVFSHTVLCTKRKDVLDDENTEKIKEKYKRTLETKTPAT